MEFKQSKDDNKKQFNQNISKGGLISQKLMNTPLMQQKVKEHQAIFGDSVTQLKLLLWKNPSIKGIDSGFNEAYNIADKIDEGTEKGYKKVNNAIENISKIEDWKDFKNQFSEIKSIKSNNIDNFTNKVNDWVFKEQKHPPSKEAGSVIEAYATLEAKNIGSVSTQFILGGSRPDFKISTGETYNDKNIIYNADSLVDATSQEEATKGHILGKVTRNVNLKDENDKDKYVIKNYPHLWDSYYSPIKWGKVNTKKSSLKIKLDNLMEERQKQKDEEAEQAQKRKKSLRRYNKGKMLNDNLKIKYLKKDRDGMWEEEREIIKELEDKSNKEDIDIYIEKITKKNTYTYADSDSDYDSDNDSEDEELGGREPKKRLNNN